MSRSACGRFNITKIEHPGAEECDWGKKKSAIVPGGGRHQRSCVALQRRPSVITEVNLPGNTSMFNTRVCRRFISFCYCAAPRKRGWDAVIVGFFHAENSALVLTVRRRHKTWMLPGSGSYDTCRGPLARSLARTHVCLISTL